ncbi:hypothetical protein HPT27_06655 [Permianibacter sp. IMCC34836]|uniref:hypothetical protein n=1 Tax=Permianibacter fluminis TaxID=2738515 RepID=UPI001554A234|nr:hypothetical protein [Permianibacter fluminis]NQD36700.1 hypothetical protein [Permianibacter fluminis]
MKRAAQLSTRFIMALIAAVWLNAPAALAAEPQVYRCGDSYSQVPCGDNASQPKLYGARGGAELSALEKARSCAAAVATSRPPQEDGSDWQLLDASEAKPDLIAVNGAQVLGFRLSVTMAQRTAHGQLQGRQQFLCAVSQDFQRVLSVQASP